MANLEDTIRSAAPGGSIAKPLLIALVALLASGALFRGSSTGPASGTGSSPTSDEGAGGLLGGLVDCWTNYRRVAWATWSIPGLVPGKISRSHLNSLAQR